MKKLQAKCLPIQDGQAVIKEWIGKLIGLKGKPLSRRMEDEDMTHMSHSGT